jgi:hypothetical protein
MKRGQRTSGVAAVTAVIVVVISGSVASAAPAVPRLIAPRGGAVVDTVPPFAWSATRGANHYEFEIAADSKFESPVLGHGQDQFQTFNTRATLLRMIPNGSYWWHVRAVTKDGNVSPWSPSRALKKSWKSTPRLVWPSSGARVNFPGTPLTLRWTPVSGAAKYRVLIANDEQLSSLVGGKAIETSATSLTPGLTPGAGTSAKTYYWSVVPVDAGGNSGAEASPAKFEWGWPSETQVTMTDLRPEAETFDPQFSWKPVDGAAAYELDVNSSEDFTAGSRVCCTQAIVGTSWSPPVTLADNTYYWRVRALDASGDAGVWNMGPDKGRFQKVFDKWRDLSNPACESSLSGCSSILGLHMRDNVSDPAPAGPTRAPLAVWSQVPGASSYLIEMVPFRGTYCDWTAAPGSHWRTVTGATAWTPLGSGLRVTQPYPDKLRPVTELPGMTAGTSYCIRVRAQSDKDVKSGQVYGDFTYLNGNDKAAFTFSGYCGTTCSRGYLSAADYLLPQGVKTTTPYFTWQPTKGASWFVIVAKDREFHTIVDYAFTQIPVYAPRTAGSATTYSDETTAYYWAVLPATGLTGADAVGDPMAASPASFNKQSTPPDPIKPAAKESVTGQPVFQWTPVEGALRYHLQVSKDDDFGKTVDDVVTDSVSYTSNTSYPPDVALYWRVRAEDTKLVGLTWSSIQTFKYHLAVPDLRGNPLKGDTLPTWTWKPVSGAVTYDVHAELPNGTNRDFGRIPSAAFTPTKMTGTGVFSWKVRANFSKGRNGVIPGPYSAQARFTRTIPAPTRTSASVGVRAVVLSWSPRLGAKSYKVQVSIRPDFSRFVDAAQTNSQAYAPLLRQRDYFGHKLYWRVAAVDEDGNQGNYSKPRVFRLPRGKR